MFIDFVKAFDMVSHAVVIKKLHLLDILALIKKAGLYRF